MSLLEIIGAFVLFFGIVFCMLWAAGLASITWEWSGKEKK